MDVGLLQLLQLADSALPIGTLAHSFGFETLAAEDTLRVDCLAEALDTYLEESLLMEATFCRAAYGTAVTAASLRDLNGLLSARKPAREMRDASLTLGRRFLAILRVCTGEEHWEKVGLCHLSIAFGLACRQLGIERRFLYTCVSGTELRHCSFGRCTIDAPRPTLCKRASLGT